MQRIAEIRSKQIGVTSEDIQFNSQLYLLDIFNNHATAIIYVNPNGDVATTTEGMPVAPKTRLLLSARFPKNSIISIISNTAATPVAITGFTD